MGSSKPPAKTAYQYYKEARERHYAGLEKWRKGFAASDKCDKLLQGPNPEDFWPCFYQLPPPETFLPKDRIGNEGFIDYVERKDDEWDEKRCFYEAAMDARYLSEMQRIENQCKRDLEIKRLRKEVEKLNKQRQQ